MITEYEYFIQYQNLFVCMIRYGSKKGKKISLYVSIHTYQFSHYMYLPRSFLYHFEHQSKKIDK